MSFFALDSRASRSSAPTRHATSRFARIALVLVSTIAPAASLFAGCAYDGSTETEVQELNANTRIAYDFFISKGLTPVQAAGVVGNLIQESNVNPMSSQAGGPGRGIAQWSVGGRWDHDSRDNAVWYAGTRGLSVWSLDLQLQFVWYELTNFSWLGLSQLRAATTVSAATIAFQDHYEGCGTCLQSQRITYSQQVYNAYSASTWGASFVSQSFPYASAGAVSIRAGSTATISLTMRNSGTHAWDSRTCIATTGPRDRSSVFAGSEWRGANRPSCVPAGMTVAAGANHTFTWVMHAPAATGRYDEHWGMVEEGVTWFSASGQGGPADDNLEGIFTVTAAPAPTDAGVADAGRADSGTSSDASMATDASAGDDAANETDAASDDVTTSDASDAGNAGRSDAASDGRDGGDGGMGSLNGGCNAAGGRGSNRSGAGVIAAGAIALVLARRRRQIARS